jgi:hypothetical protein
MTFQSFLQWAEKSETKQKRKTLLHAIWRSEYEEEVLVTIAV